MPETVPASTSCPPPAAARDFVSRFGEGRILAAMLAVYAALSLFIWGGFETQYDDTGYTDPAASYVLGQGFTSGCWYAQSHDEFWSGNVPLHQLLLIAVFKVFGFSKMAAHGLETFYTCVAIALVWLAMRRTGWIPEARLRLGAIAFFLASSNSVMMAIGGRPESLCLLLASIAWVALTFQNPRTRWAVLAVCGALAPWIGLQLAVFLAFFGILALVFSWKKQWTNVLALACGGVAGTIALLFFYGKMGTLDAFLISIAPHSLIPAAGHRPIEGVSYLPPYDQLGGPRLAFAGYRDPSVIYGILLSAAVCWSRFRNKAAARLIALDWAVMVGLPVFFTCVGIFPYYYAPFLFLPMSVLLFALLSVKGRESPAARRAIVAMLWLSAILPASYFWRLAAQGIPSFLDHSDAKTAQALQRVIRPGDVAWVEINLWYATKPLAKRTLSAHWGAQAKTAKERDDVSVVITVKAPESVKCLPGTWKETGEIVEIPDYHRFYRIFREKSFYHFAVYRRVPTPGE